MIWAFHLVRNVKRGHTKFYSTLKVCTTKRERVWVWNEHEMEGGKKICDLARNIFLLFCHQWLSALWTAKTADPVCVRLDFFRQRVKAWANRGLHKWHPLTDRKWSALHRNPWDKKAVAKKREAQGLSLDRMDFSFHILNVYLFKPVLRVLTTKWHYIHFSNLQLFLGKNLLNFFYEFLL